MTMSSDVYTIERHAVDDWEVLYLNGHEYMQAHSGTVERFMRSLVGKGAVSIVFAQDSYYEAGAVCKTVHTLGRFPRDLDDFRRIFGTVGGETT